MGTKLDFTLDLPGATKVALKVDHDKDGLIDEEKYIRLVHDGAEWRGTVELAGEDPEGVLYVYAVTTPQSTHFKVTVVRRDTGVQLGNPFTGAIANGSYYIARWVGGP